MKARPGWIRCLATQYAEAVLPEWSNRFSLSGRDAVFCQEILRGLKMIGGDPNGGIDVALVDVEGEQAKITFAVDPVKFFELIFGATGAELRRRLPGAAAKKIAGQTMVRRCFTVDRQQG